LFAGTFRLVSGYLAHFGLPLLLEDVLLRDERRLAAALLHGAVGGVLLGGGIAGCMALGGVLLHRDGWGLGYGRHGWDVLLGLLGGLGGGGVIVWSIVELYPEIGSTTKLAICLIYPSLGSSLGVGVALGRWALHSLSYWHRFITPYVKVGRIERWRATLWQILYLSLLFSIPTAVLLYSTGIVVVWFSSLPSDSIGGIVTFAVLEVTDFLVGGVGIIAAIIVGQLLMCVGIAIPGTIKDSGILRTFGGVSAHV
jgi:hypothetical protein